MAPVTGGHPKLLVVDDGRGDLLISVRLVYAAPEIQQGVVKLPASGEPVGHARSGLVEHEQLQLRAELLVVPRLGLGYKLEMLAEGLLVFKGVYVYALKLIVVLVSAPVRAGDGSDLEGGAEQLLGGGHVRSAAEIDEIVAGVIHGQLFVLGKIEDELGLVFLPFEKRESLAAAQLLYGPAFLPFEDVTHLALDELEIVVGEISREEKIIVEAVGYLRADGVPDVFLPEDLDDGLGKDVSQRMAVYAGIELLVLFFVHGKLSCLYV